MNTNITIKSIEQAAGLRKAALIHCRFWGMESGEWITLRNRLMDENDKWPYDAFWAEVDSVCKEYGIN